jgi:hypothetical protein
MPEYVCLHADPLGACRRSTNDGVDLDVHWDPGADEDRTIYPTAEGRVAANAVAPQNSPARQPAIRRSLARFSSKFVVNSG